MKQLLILSASFALAFAISGAARAQQAITPEQLVGVWKLQSIIDHDESTGKNTISPFSIGYTTLVREGKNLRTSVNFSTPNRKEADRDASDTDAVQLFNSYLAYSGILELSSTATPEGTPGITTIDVDLQPSGIGPHSRIYALNGTKLTVTIKATPTLTSTSVFEKVQ
jgi:Lipocalin-like domain